MCFLYMMILSSVRQTSKRKGNKNMNIVSETLNDLPKFPFGLKRFSTHIWSHITHILHAHGKLPCLLNLFLKNNLKQGVKKSYSHENNDYFTSSKYLMHWEHEKCSLESEKVSYIVLKKLLIMYHNLHLSTTVTVI